MDFSITLEGQMGPEMSEHVGYERQDPDGRNRGNSCRRHSLEARW